MEKIRRLLLFAVTIAILIIIIMLVGLYRNWTKKQVSSFVFSCFYTGIVILFTVILRSPYAGTHIKIIPLWFLFEGGKYRPYYIVREILVNIGLLLPIGITLKLGFSKTKARTLVLLGLCISFIIELVQLLSKKGAFEFNDIMFNTLGVYLGYWLGLVLVLDKKGDGK